MASSRLFQISLIIVLFLTTNIEASLLPFDWSFNTGMRTIVDSEAVYFQTPAATFNDAHSIFREGSVSSASYAIAILNASADYVIQVQHSCVQTNFNQPTCSSSGRIDLTPRFDVLVTMAMDYTHTLPTDPTRMDFWLISGLTDTGDPIYGDGRNDSTDLAGPHSGSRSFTGSFILPANQTSTIQYLFRVMYFGGAANGVAATGDGSLHMTMTALPEPGTLGLMVLAFIPLARRQRRH